MTTPQNSRTIRPPESTQKTLAQDGEPLEWYAEEFFELFGQVSWDDSELNNAFLGGLDDDLLSDVDRLMLEDFLK